MWNNWKRWPSIFGRSFLFMLTKMTFLTHFRYDFSVSIKKIWNVDNFLICIFLACKILNYYYYYLWFSNFKVNLRLNDNSDWLEIFRTPSKYSNLLCVIYILQRHVLTRSYSLKPLKIAFFSYFSNFDHHLRLNGSLVQLETFRKC